MKLIENPAALKKFRRTAWKFQQTFETPLICWMRIRFRHASSAVCLSSGLGKKRLQALLALLGGWVGFIFVPEPKSFAIYADHDEFTTFSAQTRSNLNRVVQALSGQGFKLEREYVREL